MDKIASIRKRHQEDSGVEWAEAIHDARDARRLASALHADRGALLEAYDALAAHVDRIADLLRRQCPRSCPRTCDFNPEVLVGRPIGMFHCPSCGTMVVAGGPHGPVDPMTWCPWCRLADALRQGVMA